MKKNEQNGSMANRLEAILPYVENPGRYVGGEANQIVKRSEEVLASIAWVFPDVYELGMSHNGTKILYHVINRSPDLAMERSFAPALDMAEQLRRNGIPLYTLESYRPISMFSAVGISLQTELNYTNVPYLLELGGLPAFARHRTEEAPFVIGGGPCMANPEPVADFFDLFVIGDGEILTEKILRIIGRSRAETLSRRKILERLSELKGVYVPAFLEQMDSPRGERIPVSDMARGAYKRTSGVQRYWVEVLDRNDYPVKNLVPNMKLVHDRYAIEVMRGCTQGCRFCQAGYWYRPNRELEPDAVVELAKAGLEATGERDLGLLSLSTADYGQIGTVTDYMAQDDDFQNVNLSLPSLRANSFGQDLAQKVAFLGNNRSATFAPETGSERLRKMINKTISDADMYQAAEGVFKNGFNNVKLYTMVGLPTEDLEDMKAFCKLIAKLNGIAQHHGRRNRIHANIGILVSKPVTPMQWCGLMPREKVMRHINYVRNYFRDIRSVKITWSDYDLAHVESFYSKGDRSLSAMIYEAYKRGMVLESFSEHFSYAGWQEIWDEFGYDQSLIFEDRDLDETFPWDFIHAGVSKGYLKAEFKKMFNPAAEPIPDCKWGDCQHCGIPGNYEDIDLAAAPTKYKAPSVTVEDIKKISERRREQRAVGHPYLIYFSKAGLSRFLSHQVTLSIFERAFRRLKKKFQYSQGMKPKPIIKNTGALPLGLASRCEVILVELEQLLDGDLGAWCGRLSEIMPDGMEVVAIERRADTKLPQISSVNYRLTRSDRSPKDYRESVVAFLNSADPKTIVFRDRELTLNKEIKKIWIDHEELWITASANGSGNTKSPFVLYAGLLDAPVEKARTWSISKESVVMA